METKHIFIGFDYDGEILKTFLAGQAKYEASSFEFAVWSIVDRYISQKHTINRAISCILKILWLNGMVTFSLPLA
ncbi:MAG: hypothetical protein HQL01_05255 [Nitrospirae bacterium]|nr:hypothetical protein [Nitrospirota bacterium]